MITTERARGEAAIEASAEAFQPAGHPVTPDAAAESARPAPRRTQWWRSLPAAMGVLGGAVAALVIGSEPMQHDHAPLPSTAEPAARVPRPGGALVPREALEALQHMSIQRDNRVESLEQFAEETLNFITGGASLGPQDPVQTLFSLMARPADWRAVPLIAVRAPAVRDQLGMDAAATHISLEELMHEDATSRVLSPVLTRLAAAQPLSPAERDVLLVYAKGALLSDVMDQRLRVVPPPPHDASPLWMSILEPEGYVPEQQIGLKRVWGTLLLAMRHGNPEQITMSAERLTYLLQRLNQRSVRMAHATVSSRLGP